MKKEAKSVVPADLKGTEIDFYAEKYHKKLKMLCASELSDVEFHRFISLGRLHKANPFNGEIWSYKYDKSKPAIITLGRNFYRKRAQEQTEYKGHFFEAIYKEDVFAETFTGKDGLNFTFEAADFADRKTLVGAFCVVYRNDIDLPFFHTVRFNEYNKNQALWKEKPAGMLKKVVEAQCLHLAFTAVFSGVISEAEQPFIDTEIEEMTPEATQYPETPPPLTQAAEPIPPTEATVKEPANAKTGKDGLFEK